MSKTVKAGRALGRMGRRGGGVKGGGGVCFKGGMGVRLVRESVWLELNVARCKAIVLDIVKLQFGFVNTRSLCLLFQFLSAKIFQNFIQLKP